MPLSSHHLFQRTHLEGSLQGTQTVLNDFGTTTNNVADEFGAQVIHPDDHPNHTHDGEDRMGFNNIQ